VSVSLKHTQRQRLGAALARQLAAQEAVVGLVARRRHRLSDVLADCRATSPDSAMWAADLADTAAVGELALQAWDALGGIDVLINNAAIPKRRPVAELRPDEVEAPSSRLRTKGRAAP
jgi:short-subunit dehydrogenase